MPRKRKKLSLPKLRRGWKINPKTRVKLSGKLYKRTREKKKIKSWRHEI